MADPENRIFCRLDGLTSVAREQKRLTALKKLGLLEAETVAVFDEATQTAARFLDAPICILGFMTQDYHQLKSAVGLSRVGLMNPLAQSRQLLRRESFCTYVVDSHQVLAIQDTATNPVFTESLLVGHYGIRAYLGAPLLTADEQCLGTLAVMDWEPRGFTTKDAEFLAITARWSLSEFERNHLLKEYKSSVLWRPQASGTPEYPSEDESDSVTASPEVSSGSSTNLSSTNSIKVKLLSQLTQELRSPLTSVMGMARVLGRQVYGPLTSKQKEYLEIIHLSGQHLVSLVDEIVALGLLDETSGSLHLTSVDIEMLCQQAINSLFEMAKQRQQEIRLSVEPGRRIWLLDKEKVRQILYCLSLSVIHSAEVGSEVRIHVSRKSDKLNIMVWVSHLWLGNSLPEVYEGIAESLQAEASADAGVLGTPVNTSQLESRQFTSSSYQPLTHRVLSSTSLCEALNLNSDPNRTPEKNESPEGLALLLSCHLAELHQGQIAIQGSLESGERYVLSLPQLESDDERL